MKKRLVSLLLVLATLLSLGTIAVAANYTTSYSSYTTPSSSDYAYWSGTKVVKASGTTVNEIKWMQAALNYCIKNKGLSASLLDVDGSFGPASKKACLAFQKKYGLSQDGSFGPATIAKMKEVLKTPQDKTTTTTTTKTTVSSNIIYNRSSAVSYGKSHWNDGVGLCAEFVSNCLKAGGLKSWNRECTNLYNQLKNEVVSGSKIASVQYLTTSGNYIKVSDNAGKISKGDVLFWLCSGCPNDSVGGPYQHTAIVSDVSGTYVKVYQHNSAKNNANAWVGNCYECGRAYSHMVAIHFK